MKTGNSKAKKITTLKTKDVVYDPIRLEDNSIGWIKKNRSGSQQIIENSQFDHDGQTYEAAFSYFGPDTLILPSDCGKLKTADMLLSDLLDLISSAIVLPSSLDLYHTAVYNLATWNFEEYKTISYLAATGAPGCGKTQFLDVNSNLCHKVFHSSGVDTLPVLFRSMDLVRGTLAMDECQQDATNSASDFHKMLAVGNRFNGAMKRCEQLGAGKTFVPVSYNVFGPKILVGRSVSQDGAMARRIYEIGMRKLQRPALRSLVQSESAAWQTKAASLRNDLLLYRQRRRLGEAPKPDLFGQAHARWDDISTEAHQVFDWLLAECPDSASLNVLIDSIEAHDQSVMAAKPSHFEPLVILAAHEAARTKGYPLISDIIDVLEEWKHPKPKPKTIGTVFRTYGIQPKHTNKGAQIQKSAQQLRELLEDMGISVPSESASHSSQSSSGSGVEGWD